MEKEAALERLERESLESDKILEDLRQQKEKVQAQYQNKINPLEQTKNVQEKKLAMLRQKKAQVQKEYEDEVAQTKELEAQIANLEKQISDKEVSSLIPESFFLIVLSTNLVTKTTPFTGAEK